MAEALRHWEQSRNLRKRQCDCLTKSDTAMKKLKKFVLSSSCLSLDENAMSKIVGGIFARATSCGTSCGSGDPVYIFNCNGDCYSKEGKYVVCIGPTKEYWKYC